MNIGGSRWVALASVALALVVTACSSGTDETVVPLTDPTTTSTTAPPTSAPTTTAAPTTTTPTPIVETTVTTTAAPATTTADIDPETERLIAETLKTERRLLLDALGVDGNKSGDQFVGVVTPERQAFLIEILQSRAELGRATTRGAMEAVELITVTLLDDSRALALTCVTSDSVLYDVGSGEVLDDSLAYSLRTATLVLGDSWLVSEQTTLASGPGPESCVP